MHVSFTFSSRILIRVTSGLTFLKSLMICLCMWNRVKYYVKKLLNCLFFCFCFNRFCFVTRCFCCCLRNCKSTFHDSNETIFSQEDRINDESNATQININSNDTTTNNNTNNNISSDHLNVENLGSQSAVVH